jgi:hypothetical protein
MNRVDVQERVAVVLISDPPHRPKPWKVKWRGREYVAVEVNYIPIPAQIKGHLCHEFLVYTGTLNMMSFCG